MPSTKHDHDKVRLELIPPELLMAAGTILTSGAVKYGDGNWLGGMKWSRIIGATMRHFEAWRGGQDLDEESGKSHLWHVATNIAFLITYEQRCLGEDDRR